MKLYVCCMYTDTFPLNYLRILYVKSFQQPGSQEYPHEIQKDDDWPVYVVRYEAST